MSRLRADGLTLGYAGPAIVQDLDVALLDGKVTAIVGATPAGSRLCSAVWPGCSSRGPVWSRSTAACSPS